MLILHLSDLHFGRHSRFQGEDLPALAEKFSQELRRAQGMVGMPGAIDLVVVSGDVAESGKPVEFRRGAEFLFSLAGRLEVDTQRFIFVPGNHDVSWTRSQNAEWKYLEDLEDEAEAIPEEMLSRVDKAKLQPYLDFLAGFYGVVDLDQLPGYSPLARGAYLLDFSDLQTSLAALNSCERESHRPEDRIGQISPAQADSLMQAWRQAPRNSWIKIVVVHHNPDLTVPANIESWREYAQQSGGISEKLLERYQTDLVGIAGREHLEAVAADCSVQLILHGHHHAQSARIWSWRREGAAYVLSAGSFGLQQGKLPGSEPCSVVLIRLDAEQRKLHAQALKYDDRFRLDGSVLGGGFVPDPAQPEGFVQTLHLPEGLRTARPAAAPAESESRVNLSAYLRYLRGQTSHIDIRGLHVGSAKAMRFPIQELYIPLTTALPGAARKEQVPGQEGQDQTELRGEGKHVELHEALQSRQLVIVGDPGAGKTTFLRRTCNLLCQARLEGKPELAADLLRLQPAPLPILIRLADFHQFRENRRKGPKAPSSLKSPAWLAHYLQAAAQEIGAAFPEAFLTETLEVGQALVLLDGLDEAPSRQDRRGLSEWIQAFSDAYENCPVVVTSRPAAFRDESVLPGFAHVQIDALGDDAVEAFLTRWTGRLFHDNEAQAKEHLTELLSALQAREEIRQLARNPVMLTALAVVHWNERRMPEQRSELYESILMWLSRSREMTPNRMSPERCLGLLQNLALQMQNQPKGRRIQITRHHAARSIADGWRELPKNERAAAAEDFLRREEVDSGIVVGRGNQIRFWHLTFQEYLAARALAARPDEDQGQILYAEDKLYRAEWQEVIRLLAGVLHRQGIERADHLFTAVLERAQAASGLENQARAAGLLGGILADLSVAQYQVPGPGYRQLLEGVMPIFEREKSVEVPIEVAIEAAEAIGQAGDPRLSADRRQENWIEIPVGEFWMGAQKDDPSSRNYDPDPWSDEGPVHLISLDGYSIGRYPVTVAEYCKFVDDGGYQCRELWAEGGHGKSTEPRNWKAQCRTPNRPVVGVSWFEAAAYARWAGCSLPTEAQWERAARGEEGNRFPWGADEPNSRRLNYGWNVGHPTPVGVYPEGSTPEGVADMAGNVWEWCQDWFAKYLKSPKKNPIGPKKGEGRVLRGGAWRLDAGNCRCSFRNHYPPDGRYDGLGFRLVFGGLSARTKKRKS